MTDRLRPRRIAAALALAMAPAVVLVFGLSQPAAGRENPSYETRLDWKPCWFDSEPHWPETACGILEVPEDRTKPEGRTVRLPFVVFRAFSPMHGEVPVLVTGGGGPGNPVGIPSDASGEMNETAWYNTSAMSVYSGRDLIVMDNRGVGSAEPRLSCPGFEALALDELSTAPPLAEALKTWSRAFAECRRQLTEAGIDVKAYNNVTAAQDIEDLRRALGLSKLNLFGVSYGTRIALTYLRDFPRATRAVVLDGVDPPEVRFHEVFPKISHQAIKRVFDLCREDRRCRERYGADLYDRFLAYLPELEAAPITLRVTNPSTVSPMTVVLTPDLLVATLHSAIYFNDRIGRVPRAIAALLNGGTDYIAGLVRYDVISLVTEYPLDDGAYASYQCHGTYPFSDMDRAQAEVAKYPVQHYMNEAFLQFEQVMCAAWQVTPGERKEARPVVSDVPVLLFSGELDPITPHSAALSAARTLARSHVKEWPGIGHNVLSVSSCADQIAAAFFDAPRRNPLYHSCIRNEPAPRLYFE